jgi:hypothetical protein
METRKILVEIPVRVYEQCQDLVQAGVFADIEQLLQQVITMRVAELLPLLQPTKREKNHLESEECQLIIEEMQAMMKARGGIGKTSEEILEELRKTRREIWEKEYAPYIRYA